MKTAHGILHDNTAQSKGVRHGLSWIVWTVVVIGIVVSPIVIFVNLMWALKAGSMSGHWLGTVGVALIAGLAIWLVKNRDGSSIRKLAQSMNDGVVFNPQLQQEHYALNSKMYMGIDFKTGVVGIASVYKRGDNNRKRLMFEASMIESYEAPESKLILNLRNTSLPVIVIDTVNPDAAYRQIEMVCNMESRYGEARNRQYIEKRKQLVDAGWMLDRDY